MKSIQAKDGAAQVPDLKPLDKHSLNIYEVAEAILKSMDRLRAILRAISMITEFPSDAARIDIVQKTVVAQDLAKLGVVFGDDVADVHGCMLADCMLASEDPEIRAAARP